MKLNIEKIIFNLSPETINSIITNIITDSDIFKMNNNQNMVDVIEAYKNDIEMSWNISLNQIYTDIIETIAYNTGIYIDYDNLNDNDLYLLSSSIYDIFISNMYNNLVDFIINYITMNKNSIYKSLELDKFKKSRDVDIIYNSELIDDKELVLILSKLENVINSIFSIDFADINILQIAGYNSEKLNCILNYTNLNSGIILPKYKKLLLNDLVKSSIMNDIKLYFHNQNKEMSLIN